MKARTKCKGRSKLRVANMDNYVSVNKPILKNYWPYTILPHHKFPHPSWRKFTPNDKHSFYAGVREELAIPDDVVEEVFWDGKLVPLSSLSLIDWRGNSDQAVRKCYKSKSV